MNNIRIYLSMSADGVGGEDEDDSLLIYYLFLFRGEKEETKKIVICVAWMWVVAFDLRVV